MAREGDVRSTAGSSRGPLVFVGGLTLDTVVAVPHYPGADERVVAEQLITAGGGPAGTAAVTAARLGAPDVRVYGAVGEDRAGRELVAELVDEGIDVTGVVQVPRAATGTSVVVVDLHAGTRAISARPGPQIPTVDPDVLRTARWIHVDHLGWHAVQSADAADVRMSVDVSYLVDGFDLHGVDLFVPSLQFLEAMFRDCGDILEAAQRAGACRVVATRGANGCVAIDADGTRLHAPGERVEVVSSLGAGDVFHGALLAAIDRGDGLEAAMSFANKVAARSCRGLDGRSRIPYAAEIRSLEV